MIDSATAASCQNVAIDSDLTHRITANKTSVDRSWFTIREVAADVCSRFTIPGRAVRWWGQEGYAAAKRKQTGQAARFVGKPRPRDERKD